MAKIRVAINGFGRIGRVVTRFLMERPDIELVAVNDLAEPATLAHLMQYDSIHGVYPIKIKAGPQCIFIGNSEVKVFSEKDPVTLPWKELQIDVVIESTGKFTKKETASTHLTAGAGKVIISAPAGPGIKTVVLGVNDHILEDTDRIISNASCTTNNVTPMLKILDELGDIERGYISTVHAYTGDQRLHDAPHKDLRRARAAANSIIPTSTGAAKAAALILPHLEGKLGGTGIRVPVIDGSLTDLTCITRKQLTVAQINEAFRKAADGSMKGILEYTSDPIVSVDVIGNRHSCIFDSQLSFVMGPMVKIVGWYDNESGYACRLAELAERIGK